MIENINEKNYDNFIEYLYSLQDIKYRDFQKKLIQCDNMIGVRVPELKRIAKIIARGDYKSYFKLNKHNTFEETLIHGLVLGYLKLDFNTLKPFIDDFLPHINNWAVCDMTASNLKEYKRNKTKDICFKKIKNYIKNENYWINRFGYVLLLDYYVVDEYIDEIFKLCEDYKDEYYVKMSIAWLISICYIKYRDKTLKFLKNNKLDDWTYNKSIQKIIESNRISIEEKNKLKEMKKK